MSKILIILSLILGVSFSGCAKKVDEYNYNRAKNASDKALKILESE
jgi:hypothetical protein